MMALRLLCNVSSVVARLPSFDSSRYKFISSNNKSKYQGRLDKVTITVYQDFSLDNKQVVVNDGTN